MDDAMTGFQGREEPGDAALRLALEVVPDAAVVVDEEGHIVGANQALNDLFGHEAATLLGQRVELLIPERFRHAHRHHRSEFMANPRQRAMGAGLQLFGRRRDATEFPVDISLAPLEVGDRRLVVAAIRDATERGAVAAAVGQLAAIVSSSRDGILTMTTAGVVTTWNPGAEELLGTPSEQAVGSHIGRWVPEDQSEILEELMSSIVTGGSPAPQDTVWRTDDHKSVDVAISLSPMHDEYRKLAGFSLLVRDITERKSAEQARLRQHRLQEASAAVRLSALSDAPLETTLGLVCEHVADLTGATGAAVVREHREGRRLEAASGVVDPDDALELADTLLEIDRPGATRLDLEARGPGEPAAAVGAVVPAEAGRRWVVVALVPGDAEAGDACAVVEGFAGQAALAIELAQARAARERLLLAEDRERIARDLHDLVIQRLFATGMTLQTIQGYVGDQALVDRLRQTTEELDTTIREIRTTIFALETAPSTSDGVRSDLLRLVTESAKGLGFHPSLQFEGPVDLVDAAVRTNAVAVAREALSNVARHAEASSVRVLVRVGNGFTLLVEDDGKGLPEDRLESGLANLKERAAELGGTCTVERRVEGGTRVLWQVPS